jgi:hypothetical protein
MAGASSPRIATRQSSTLSPKSCATLDTASSRSKMAVPPSNCPSSFPNIHLLLTNTRLGGMDGPALIKLVRYMRPGVRILHIADVGEAEIPQDVLTLQEPFTSHQLLLVMGSLLA